MEPYLARLNTQLPFQPLTTFPRLSHRPDMRRGVLLKITQHQARVLSKHETIRPCEKSFFIEDLPISKSARFGHDNLDIVKEIEKDLENFIPECC